MRSHALIFMMLLGTNTSAADWTSSSALVAKPPFQRLSADAAAQIASKLTRYNIRYYLEDRDLPWHIHHGDLRIDASLDNSDALIVDGNLTITGDYDDYGDGTGLLVVLGDLNIGNVATWGALYVAGDLNARGGVYAYYNDFTFEVVGKVNARGIVVDDKSSDYRVGKTDFELHSESDQRRQQTEIALRTLVPELFDVGDFEYDADYGFNGAMPDFRVVQKRLRKGETLLRDQVAAPSMIDALKLSLQNGVDARRRLALIDMDPLVRRSLSLRDDLQPAVRKALLASADADVQRAVAGSSKIVGELGDLSSISPAIAAGIVANEASSAATLAQLAASTNADIRLLVAARIELPRDLIALLARDNDVRVRREVATTSDNIRRLDAGLRTRLANDADARVRAAAATTPLDYAQSIKLAADGDADVRRALAASLAEQATPASNGPLDRDQVGRLATQMLGDLDGSIQQALLPALPAAAQSAFAGWNARSALAIAPLATDPALIRALFARADDHALQVALASNPSLPNELQRQIVERADVWLSADGRHQRLLVLDTLLGEQREQASALLLDDSPGKALDQLLEQDSVDSASLLAAAKLLARYPKAALSTPLLHRRDLPAAAIDVIDARLKKDEDWALTLTLNHHASRSQLNAALLRWYDDDEAMAARLKALRPMDDPAWWNALASSEQQPLRAAAANNANLPSNLLQALLADRDDEVRAMAAGNPMLPMVELQKLVLTEPGLALSSGRLPVDTLRNIAETGNTAALRRLAREQLSNQLIDH